MSTSLARYRPPTDTGEHPSEPHCYCSLFLSESAHLPPRYIAAGYQHGVVRIHDVEALSVHSVEAHVQSELLAFVDKNACIVEMESLHLGSDTVLITLDAFGEVAGWSLNEIQQIVNGTRYMKPTPRFRCTSSMTDTNISCICVNEATNQLITGDCSGYWSCWDLERLCSTQYGVPTQIHSAHDAELTKMDCFNGILASSSADGTVCIWDIRSESCISAIDPLVSKVLPLNKTQRSKICGNVPSTAVQFDKSGRHVVAASRERYITVWNVRSDTAQCAFETESSTHTLNTSGDYIFCAGLNGSIARYSSLCAEMVCFRGLQMDTVCDIHISRKALDTVLVSGAHGTIEMLSLDGDRLGLCSIGKESSNQGSVQVQRMEDVSPTWWEGDTEGRMTDHFADEDAISVEDFFEENDDLCESGTDEGVCSEAEEAGRYIVADNFSSVWGFSETNEGSFFSSDEELGSAIHEMEHPEYDASSLGLGDGVVEDEMDQGEDDLSSYSLDTLDAQSIDGGSIVDVFSGDVTSEDEDSLHG